MAKASWPELKIEAPFEFFEPIAELFRRYCKGGVAIENAGGWNPDEGESPPERQSAIIRAYMPQTPAYRSNREMVHIACSSSAPTRDPRRVPLRAVMVHIACSSSPSA